MKRSRKNHKRGTNAEERNSSLLCKAVRQGMPKELPLFFGEVLDVASRVNWEGDINYSSIKSMCESVTSTTSLITLNIQTVSTGFNINKAGATTRSTGIEVHGFQA
jgi:hypothetical protein